MKTTNISFGQLFPQPKEKLNEIAKATNDERFNRIADDIKNNEFVTMTTLNENTSTIIGYPQDFCFDMLTVEKSNSDEIKINSDILYPNKTLFLKTRNDEEKMIKQFDKKYSHIISAWILANRIKERCEAILNQQPTDMSIWKNFRIVTRNEK